VKIKVSVGDFKIGQKEKEAIIEVINSGRFSEGQKVRDFEKAFAKYIGTKYAVALSSGTAALIAGLTALQHHKLFKIKRGTKIITSPVTYVATSNAIVLTGFEPVYVDIDPRTFAILPEEVEKALSKSKNTKKFSAILPVHLMGYPCDMDALNNIAKHYNLVTFEDSAQAHGTLYKGKKTGSLSLLSAFSFYIAHNIQAGEMGAITTDDPEIDRLVRKIKANGRVCACKICTRSQGWCPKFNSEKDVDNDPRFTHDIIGYNFKTMEFQATLGIAQLRKADWIFKKRQENVKVLNKGLEKYSDVLSLPPFSEAVSYLAYPIVIKDTAKISRKRLRTELEKMGIETRPLFGSIPTQQPAYSFLKERYKGKLLNADYVGTNGFYIGCHQYITEEDITYVLKCFDNIFGDLSR
jgi:dTDP-4-amino-4,6-dideoxygalactose transaminase